MKKTYRAFGYVNALRADRMWVHFFSQSTHSGAGVIYFTLEGPYLQAKRLGGKLAMLVNNVRICLL